MADLDRVGGIPVVLKILLDAGYLHGDTLTVTGKTMAENLAEINPPFPDGVVVHPADRPLSKDVGITILGGSLAPEGAAKLQESELIPLKALHECLIASS
jgi:dihydroxy-acid dehydratase